MAGKLSDRRFRHDSYYQRAKKSAFPSRAIFKLEEIDQRFSLLRPGSCVLDLGCRPGSWLLYAARRIGPQGVVVGVDRLALDVPLPRNTQVIVGDVFELDPAALIAPLPANTAFDVVLSDMAPDTIGVKFADQCRSIDLFVRALELAGQVSAPGASFVGKIFMGAGFDAVLTQVKAAFRLSKIVKPDASRKSSKEVYVVAQQRR